MGDLTIRRERGAAGVRYQAAEKTEKPSAAKESRPMEKTPGATVSQTLQRLMSKIVLAESHTRESHRTLQAGEAVLAEVQDSLSRLKELAGKAANGGAEERSALQAEVEYLRKEIDRITGGTTPGGMRLFLDGEMEPLEELLPSQNPEAAEAGAGIRQALPSWLLRGMDGLSPVRLLTMLGLDRTAGSAELLAALLGTSLEGDSAAACLAALYLGGVIAGGTASKAVSLGESLEGLRQLLEKIGQGYSPDEAVELLTRGVFTSFPDFQTQFSSGTAPGLENTLLDLLLSIDGTSSLPEVSLASLLAGMEDTDLDLMTGLLTALQGARGGAETAPAGAEQPPLPASVLDLGDIRVLGRDLSGISVEETAAEAASGTIGEAPRELTSFGKEAVLIQGTERTARGIVLAGSGTVTLRSVHVSVLTAAVPGARLAAADEAVLDEVHIRPGASLTLSGGRIRIGAVHAGEGGALHISGGTVLVMGEGEARLGTLTVPVVLEGPAFLAARAVSVTNGAGKPLSPFDIVWKTLLPGWSAVNSLSADGRHGRALLLSGEAARLWLGKGDPSQGSPVHSVIIRGKDKDQRPRTHYAYLHWNQEAGTFEEVSMYPNPFTVTGGEEGQDWVYEEGTCTLRILTGRVASVSGGAGVDRNQSPFSGRLLLEDGIGSVTLTLAGVNCRVREGGAFCLGRGNDVTLLLRSGMENHFESGPGRAGIALGGGTSLLIDCPDARDSSWNPAGLLNASGGAGGAGIGRDSGGGRDQTGRIVIRGGEVAAVGSGGGAGIGAGKRGAIGAVIILGGIVRATGESGGGAGIGGALSAPAGDIEIRGGRVTALAAGHAAAIGAGAQGACGDILITGSARIEKALGGDPGADIGACLFGSCGKVQISSGADIGRARLWTRSGVPLQMGAETVTLPQFRLSSKTLGLDQVSLKTKEAVRSAQALVERDRRWVAQMQNAYQALYTRLEQSYGSLLGVQEYLSGAGRPVRDSEAAGTLLEDTRRSIHHPSSQAMRTHGKRGTEDLRQLFR